jgi:branched-subunit amino acid ABC-type transport system permease component
MAVIEETQLRGTLLAIEELNAAGGINGREILPICYNPASEASAFGHYAKRLMTADGVTTIFGCYTSSSRKSVLPVVERLNGLLWYPTIYEGFEFSPNVIYTGAAPNQNSIALARFMLSNYGPRFYFTAFGMRLRAVVQDPSVASCFGINAGRVYATTFAYGAGLAGLAGALVAPLKSVSPEMGTGYVVDAFMVVVIGGVQSLFGAVVSAALLGEASGVLAFRANDTVAQAVVLLAVVFLIRFRPQGLFAARVRA